MIIQSKETKTQSSLIDLLGGSSKTSTTKTNDVFSKLLASLGMQNKTDTTSPNENKIVKSNDFKAVIDPKNISSKTIDTKSTQIKELQTLLGGSDEKSSTLLSNDLLTNLSNEQVRTLINRAKDYLKQEISAKNPEYKVDEKSLPKTLGGLVKLAEKLGLEPKALTLSTIINTPEEKGAFTPEFLSKPLFDAKAIATSSATIKEEVPIEALTQLLGELKAQKEPKSGITNTTATIEKNVTDNSETQPLKTLLQHKEKQETRTTPTVTLSEAPNPSDNQQPLSPTKHTNFEMLASLLQGNNESKEPKSEASGVSKVDGESQKSIHVPKAESLEVKSKEAQQSMRSFASDLKEAVQEYKPPFTRLTMKLNPEKLGEVEVTLVQRGNNVHVNIQSNNTASVAFLAHNATELKAQLAGQGITNATMNFMSGGDGQNNQQAGQQQQQEQHAQRFQAYESFEELQLNEEQLSALEIIIPHYA